jgi:hypothetical protein
LSHTLQNDPSQDQQTTRTNTNQSQAVIRKIVKNNTKVQCTVKRVILINREENNYPEILPNSSEEKDTATNLRWRIRDRLRERKNGKERRGNKIMRSG